MKNRTVFKAPWSRSLKWMTGLLVSFLVLIAAFGLTTGPRYLLTWSLSMVVMPLTILLGSACFMIRGYEVASGKLLVQRLGWRSSLDLTKLTAVEIDPEAMKGSLRTFGNGGLFSFSGAFWNRRLGLYRAFVTDPGRAVILHFGPKTVVVTPDDPEALAEKLQAFTSPPGSSGAPTGT